MKKTIVAALVAVLFTTLVFYFAFFNYLEPTEVGIARNVVSGELVLQDKGGMYLTSPWTAVAVVDTRPE